MNGLGSIQILRRLLEGILKPENCNLHVEASSNTGALQRLGSTVLDRNILADFELSSR